jgi:proline dehydrogenase
VTVPFQSVLRRAAAPLQRRAAARYVAGPRVEDALAVSRELGRYGIPTTVGYFDPDGEPAQAVAATVLEAIDAVAEAGLDCYQSVKVPSLGFDPELVGQVLARGAAQGVPIHYDALSHDTVDRSLALLDAGGPGTPPPGFTLPGGWRRSVGDADLVAGRDLRVRVVKGQYRDPDAGRLDLRAGCLEVIDRLAGRASMVAVATHDPALAAEALGRLVAAGTPCELELLYGLAAGPVLAATRELGVPVRYYVPWGRGSLTFPLWRIGELRLLRALLGDLAGRKWRHPGGLLSSGDRSPPAASVRSPREGRPAPGGRQRGGLPRNLELRGRAAPRSRVPMPVP